MNDRDEDQGQAMPAPPPEKQGRPRPNQPALVAGSAAAPPVQDEAERLRQVHLANPDALRQAMEASRRTWTPGGDTKSPIPRRFITFEVDPDACAPGIFPGPFLLTLATLTSGEELEALKDVGDDPVRIGMSLARRALNAVNGSELGPIEREWLWEALGGGGRQLASAMFAEIGQTDVRALGKARATARKH